MKLPNHKQAIIPERKIVNYLLDETHPTGKSKAAFFVRFGFEAAAWEVMRLALRTHAATHEVASVLETSEGVHYVVKGTLQTPEDRNPQVRSVWAIDTGSTIPRFITAYPLAK